MRHLHLPRAVPLTRGPTRQRSLSRPGAAVTRRTLYFPKRGQARARLVAAARGAWTHSFLEADRLRRWVQVPVQRQ